MIPSASSEGAERASAEDLKRTRRRRAANVAPNVDRLPPHTPECEQGALGCIMLSPNECMAEAIEKLRDEGREFYDLRHLTIWECLVEMYDQGIAIDVLTLQERLKEKQMLEQVGGIGYLASLPDSVPSAANLSYYLDFIVEKYILRQAIQVCTEVVGRVYDFEGEVDQLMDMIELDMIRIRERRTETRTLDIKALVQKNIQTIESYYQNQGALTGLSTGFADLDVMTSGLQKAEMIVIAARPSMGKTSLAMNIAENVAIGQKLPIGVFSLEMSAEALSLRMICSNARVNLRNIREGFLAERDIVKLTGAAGRLSGAPIYIDDSSSLTVLQLRSKARRMAARYGIKALVIDYLQLVRGSAKRYDSRQQEVGDIARGVKALAKELDIPVIILSQLNRAVEKEKSRKPRMSDLRESGEIEQSADIVGLLYRPQLDEDISDEEYFDAIPINLLIGKQRNGPTGEVNLTFLKPFTRFENAAKVSDDDVPTQGTMI